MRGHINKRYISLFFKTGFSHIALLLSLLPLTPVYAQEGGGEGQATEKSNYVALDGPLVVNILTQESIHFLQITVEFKLKDPAKAATVTTHMAPIKDGLIMLLSDKTYFELQTIEGKQKLRSEALTTVQKILKQKSGDTTIENIFFTSLVVQ